jgi:hypothetical protein
MPPAARRRDDQQPDGLHNHTSIGDHVHKPASPAHNDQRQPRAGVKAYRRYAVDPSGRALTPARARRCPKIAAETEETPERQPVDT